MALSLVTPPDGEPISLDEIKLQVLQGQMVDDQYLTEIVIPAVRDRAELATGRALLTQTWDLVLDAVPYWGWLELPKPPLRSVTFLKYRDTAGVLQTWTATNYVVEAPAGPRCQRGRIALAYGITWPSTYGQMSDVTVRFIAGYGTAADVPPLLKTAMLLDAGTLYAHRENVITETVAVLPGGADAIYRSFKSHPTQLRAA